MAELPPSADGSTSPQDATSLPDNMLIDYISGGVVPASAKELVRQHIARALFHEYEISVDDMARDFPVTVADGGRRRRRADIVVFAPKADHTEPNLRRIVVCKPEPRNGNTVTRIRTPSQAKKDLDESRTSSVTSAPQSSATGCGPTTSSCSSWRRPSSDSARATARSPTGR